MKISLQYIRNTNQMTIIHANDPTTRCLSLLYEGKEDVTCHITEANTNSQVTKAIRESQTIMMLGHGNPYGLFSKPDKKGNFNRFLITDRHVEFLRGKTCIGIWCKANQFADRYHLHGLFSGMIISELQEAEDEKTPATKEEIDKEIWKFTSRLRYCIDHYSLEEIPARMKAMDDVQSELTRFNYGNLYFLV